MVAFKGNMRKEIKEKMRQGNGAVYMTHLLNQNDTLNKSRLVAKLTLPTGSSIGPHNHIEEAEMYIIIKGQAYVTENEKSYLLHAGDVMFTGNGDYHSIENRENSDLVLYAIIFN